MGKRISPLDRAVAIAGSAKTLAGWLGVTPQALSQWKRVPGARVIAVERCTGVSRCDLRPDLYPRDEPAPIRTEQSAA
ncbi:transcriptional regulator [Bosea sp. PAMC 26642]|uniref:transcriptional regulator n=1 Tax=Bosea sp. (strain PAMC 26642) TaxID=1792307 RepID=UPI001F382AE6|nr:Cro/CI family transcriptional regulator [Bosea sp. PAMC 26642]